MATYFIKNGDDYTEVKLDDLKKSEKLIPESDLLSLKGSNDSKIKKLEDDYTTLLTEKDNLLTRATTAESASNEVKKTLESLKVDAEKAKTLETELTALKEKQSAADTQKLDSKRKSLIKDYKLEGDKAKQVETMTLEAIESLETSLELVGASASKNGSSDGFARRNNNSDEPDTRTSFAKIRDALSNGDPALRNARGSSSDDD